MKTNHSTFAKGLFAYTLTIALMSCTPPPPPPPPASVEVDKSAEQAKSAEVHLAAWNIHDTSNLQEALTADFQRWRNGVLEADGLEAMGTFMNNSFITHDAQVTIQSVDYCGDKNYVSWTYAGTNIGLLSDMIAATNKAFSFVGFSIDTFNEAGKMTRTDVYSDGQEFLGQLGFTIAPPAQGKN